MGADARLLPRFALMGVIMKSAAYLWLCYSMAKIRHRRLQCALGLVGEAAAMRRYDGGR